MANVFQIKRSKTGGNTPSSLADGELAINQADGTLFWSNSSGAIQSFTFGAVARMNVFGSRAAAVAARVPASITFITLYGYYTLGDAPVALYKRRGAAPSPAQAWHFQSADGAWWELAETEGTPEMLGAKRDGVTNDTVALQASIDFFQKLELGSGTYLAHALVGKSNIVIEGAGRTATTIKRIANAPDNNPILYFTGKSGIRVRGLTFDGNRANQTKDGSLVTLTGGCYDFQLDDVVFTGNRGGNWHGLTVLDSADLVQGTRSSITRCLFAFGDGYGASISKSSNIAVDKCMVHHVREGIVFLNLSNPPPSFATELYWSVTDCLFSDITGSGLTVSGYIVGYNGNGLPIHGYGKETSRMVLIHGNKIRNCTQYGLVFQSSYAVISNNIIESCGSDATNGGVLLNASYVTFSDNIVHANYFYGIDAGGALQCSFAGNTISFNGSAGATSGTGLSIGAGASNSIVGNKFIQNGYNGQGSNLQIPGFDGGADPAFASITKSILIKSNEFHLGDNLRFAVSVDIGDPTNIVLRDNDCFGTGAHNNPFYVSANQFYHSNNLYWEGSTVEIARNAASTVVIPDHTDLITIHGTGNINNILTVSANSYAGKVRTVRITAAGSGYTPGEVVPVTFSGGGGSGAAGVALVGNDGTVRGVKMTAFGSGYTSAPTVTFGTPGTGAAGVAMVGLNNTDGNTLTVFLSGGAVLKSGTGNMALSGGDFVGTGAKSITLFGRYGGNWYEVSRSGAS